MARANKREVGIEIEATPGTAETIVVGDLKARSRDGDTFAMDVDLFDTEEVQSTSSKRPNLAGRTLVDTTYSYILTTPNSQSVESELSDLIRAAMFISEQVKNSPIGAVAGGPFQDGETITGSISTETATVFRETATGAAELKYVNESGVMNAADVFTGSDSGATATASGAPVDNGYRYKPADSNFGGGDTLHHVTMKFFQDGWFLTGRGCLANMQMVFEVGKPVVVTQRFLGGYEAHGDVALFSPASYPEDGNIIPLFLAGSLELGSYAPTDIRQMTLNVETNPEAREDAQSVSGVLFADYQKDAPTLSLDPAFVSAATKDFFAELRAGTSFAVNWQVGTTDGSIWEFFADDCQYTANDLAAERSLGTIPSELRMNGISNDELIIWQH